MFHGLIRLAAPFILGMVTANFFIAFTEECKGILCGAALVSAVALVIIHNSGKCLSVSVRKKLWTAFGVTAMFFSFVVGGLLYVLRYESVRDVELYGEKRVEGIAVNLPVRKSRTWSVEVETVGGVRVLAYLEDKDGGRAAALRVGDTLYICSRYGCSPTCPSLVLPEDSAFVWYKRYLFNNGISATVYADDASWSVTAGKSAGNFVYMLRNTRRSMTDAYRKFGFEGNGEAIIEAMTTGSKESLTKAQKVNFSRAGISHVLALSGFHLSVIYGILGFFLCSGVVGYKHRWMACLIMIPCLWAFAVMAGMPPSLNRAFLMCCVMLLSASLGRKVTLLNSAAFAATLMLAVEPLAIADLGFQLSFLSIIGISVLAIPLSSWTYGKNAALKFVWGTMSVTIACTLFTIPVVALNFGQVPTLALFSNLVVTVLASALLFSAALWWASFCAPQIQVFISGVLSLLATVMNDASQWFASFSFSVMEWTPGLGELVSYYFALGFGISFWRHRESARLSRFLVAVISFLFFALFRNVCVG